MYLSRIILDDRRRDTMRALAYPAVFHGAVSKTFAGGDHPLWRIDYLHGQCLMLLLSREMPDLALLQEQFGRSDTTPATRKYDSFLSDIASGQCWQFRIKANPVRQKAQRERGRGRIYAHVTTEQQKEWLMSRAEANGFALSSDAFDVIDTRWYRFGRQDTHRGGKNAVTMRTATFEGVLTVTDAEHFRQALTQGIGREKAYGCGLLTIMRAGH